MVLTAQTARGPVEITIPEGVAGISDVAQACALAPGAAAPAAGPDIRTTQAEPEPAPPVAASTLRTSFDCAAAHTVAEKLVCKTPGLAAADLALHDYYLRSLAASNEASVGPGQRAFISRRNQCATVACITEAYRSRHEELAALGYVPE
jgi:hypothetical protein